jgi:hypothetical protein
MTDQLDPELEEETKEECSRFGEVLKVVSAKDFALKIRLFVEFASHSGQ